MLISLTRSESNYLSQIHTIVEVWYKPLKATPLPIVTEDQFQTMLSCIDVIYERTSDFVTRPEAAGSESGVEDDPAVDAASLSGLEAYVSACLSAIEAHGAETGVVSPLLILYSKYAVDQVPLGRLIPELEEDSMIFKGFMMDAHTHELCRGMEFPELARFPHRRIREYPILFRSLSKVLKGTPLGPQARGLCDRFQFISAEVQRNEDSGARATEIRRSLVFNSELDNLLTDSSLFITDEGVKVAVNDAPKYTDAVLVLYTDTILLCTSKKADLIVDATMALATTRVSELPPRKKAKHVLAIANNLSGTVYTIVSPSFATHTSLLRHISSTIDKATTS